MSNDALTGAELLAKINPQLREKGTGICLRPDLLDEWEEANADLNDAQAVASTVPADRRRGKGNAAEVKELAKKVRAIEEQIAESEVRFVFRAVSKDRYQEFLESNPPRKDDQFDQFAGYNRSAVAEGLVRLSLVSPVFADCPSLADGYEGEPCDHTACGSWQQFESVCNASEWEELRSTAQEVNGAVTKGPKSPLASEILDKPASTSRRRAAGE